jgi:hypothetical protein
LEGIKGRDQLKDRDVDEKVILKSIFKILFGRCGIKLSGSG